MTETLTAIDLRKLATDVLVAAGASQANAASVARALIAAELDGLGSHGLSRLPFYADQVGTGKVDGKATPRVTRTARAVVAVDAASGFAFPAIEAGFTAAYPAIKETGIVAIGIGRSHHCGVAGHHVETLAERGFVGIMFANTPAAIAPWGGKRGIFGTNPIAFACPRRSSPPLVIDLSMSVVARGRIMVASGKGETIPTGWALDRDGNPTTDAKAALAGTMVPIGDAKGAALALMVEILAAGLTGSHFGNEASSFFEAAGEPPHVGQLILALDPAAFGAASFLQRIEGLFEAMTAEDGVRLPGDRRLATRERLAATGIPVRPALLENLRKRAAG